MRTIGEVHELYFKYLMRYAENEVIERARINENLESELSNSDEAKYVSMIRDYYDLKGNKRVKEVFEIYFRILLRRPSVKELRYSLGAESLEDELRETDEYKHLKRCLNHFNRGGNGREKTRGDLPKIKYYGPIGTTGYATACREIVLHLSKICQIYFVPISVEDYNFESSPLSNFTEEIEYDYVVVHSIPTLWTMVRERESVPIHGITVWESDAVPPQWIPHLNNVDVMSVPNEWNAITLKDFYPLVIHHPMREVKSSQEKDEIYTFYTIGTWNGRKNIDSLITAFKEEFSETENVRLYIKTSGASQKSEGNIIVNTDLVSDEVINSLHDRFHCFVSLCRAEGQGLGLCHAHNLGNHVIVTGYGGQLDYLPHAHLVDYELTPTLFCNHEECANQPACRECPYFIPSQQNWAEPDLQHAKRLMREAFEKRAMGRPCEGEVEVSKIIESFKEFKVRERIEIVPGPLVPIKEYRAKKRVLFSGCYFTGNVGDASYRLIWRELFKEYEQIFTTTSKLISTRGQMVEVDYDGELLVPDYIAIGGGGLIMKSETRTLGKSYLKFARKHSIPLALLSVGIQYDLKLNDYDFIREWRELFNYASIIVVRSINDYAMIFNLLEEKRRHRLFVLPDVTYSMRELIGPAPVQKEEMLLYIPTNFLSIRLEEVRDYIDGTGCKKIVLLPFDGVTKEYPSREVKREIELLSKWYPRAIVFKGRRNELLDRDGESMSLERVYSLLNRAKYVVTGRLHGLILGKVFDCEVYTGCSNTNKIVSEMKDSLNISKVNEYPRLIERFLSLPHDVDPSEWSENHRNNRITRVSRKKGLSIKYVQSFTNEQLFEL